VILLSVAALLSIPHRALVFRIWCSPSSLLPKSISESNLYPVTCGSMGPGIRHPRGHWHISVSVLNAVHNEDANVIGWEHARWCNQSSYSFWVLLNSLIGLWRHVMKQIRMGNLRLISVMLNTLENWCLLMCRFLFRISERRGQRRIMWNYRLRVFDHMLRTGWLRPPLVTSSRYFCQPATKGVAIAMTPHSTRVRQRSIFISR